MTLTSSIPSLGIKRISSFLKRNLTRGEDTKYYIYKLGTHQSIGADSRNGVFKHIAVNSNKMRSIL